MQVNHFLEASARRTPDKTTLVCGSRRLSFHSLDTLADHWAQALVAQGIQRHERVAICLENSPEAVMAIWGTLKAGCVAVPVHPLVKPAKLDAMVNDCQAAVLLAHPDHLTPESSLATRCPSVRLFVMQADSVAGVPRTGAVIHSWDDLLESSPDGAVNRQSIDVDLACLIYTSGSTGQPKGVMLTHANMIAAATSIMAYLENTPADIILSYLPLAFDYGLYQALMSSACGGTLILEKAFVYPYAALERLRTEGVTGLPLVPAMAALLLQLEHLERLTYPSLRDITNTAQTLPVPHIRKLQAVFPQARIFLMYGLTECKRVSYLPPEELNRRPTSVGRAIPNTEAFLVDPQGCRITTPRTPGQLVVRGSHVMQGYWQRPEETAQRLKPGLFPGDRLLYTGDWFEMDEAGFLYFIARQDGWIKSGGELISPREVENTLYELGGVAEALAEGVPDPILGQVIKAWVVRQPGSHLTADDILRHCASRLEPSRVPKQVEFLAELPKTLTGKTRGSANLQGV